MSDAPGLDALKEHTEKLLGLLNDPQPGLSTWWLFLADRLREIDKFHPDGERCTGDKTERVTP